VGLDVSREIPSSSRGPASAPRARSARELPCGSFPVLRTRSIHCETGGRESVARGDGLALRSPPRLPSSRRSRDDAAGGRARTDRRGSARARRRRRPRSRSATCTSATLAPCSASRSAARRPRPRRGRVQEAFASSGAPPARYKPRPRPGRAVALRGRAERDRRPRPRPHRAAGRAGRLAVGRGRPPERAEQSWVAYRVHRAMEDLPESERCSSSRTGAACRRARSRTSWRSRSVP
jgi:hypothetical protein